MGRYDYMLEMPHKQSKKRRHMPLEDRAAQFGAFRALAGHQEAISETERLTEEWLELDEYQKSELDMKIQYILGNIEKEPEISVIYFKPEEKKSGGSYIKKKGRVKKIREFERQMLFADGESLSLDGIAAIEI